VSSVNNGEEASRIKIVLLLLLIH